jgi:PAS domain S-box-containing protein
MNDDGNAVVSATLPQSHPLPSGGGTMGEVMRSIDWAKTPLGAAGSWSPALRMMANFLLANRFPLLLWWGPQYCQLYNDAYRPILGTKHPHFTGRPGRECWSEIWDVIGPLIDTPFQGGPATWMEDILLEVNRHGYFEETHFTIAYSPVPDETAPRGIGGVLATVHEITEKVVGERRVMLLRDLGAKSAEAKSAEEACRTAARIFEAYPKDVPFAFLYLIDADRKRLRLAGAAGAAGETTSPLVAELETADEPVWPFGTVIRNDALERIDHLSQRLSAVPRGPWPDPPESAALLPIRSNIAHQPAGVLVMGLSSRLQFDDSYRVFCELIATQVATAVAKARAYEIERKRAEALAEIDRAKTTFFSNVSHEFRTPLTLILGPLENILRDRNSGLPAAACEELEVVHRNALRMQKLVNALLDFARIESGRMQAVFQPTDLAGLTSDLASTFGSALETAGLRFTVDCPPIPAPVYVDREMWEKIVLNLISNAFKFTLEGGVAISLRVAGAEVVLSVKDSGCGIPADELPRLFERFHRVEGARGRSLEGSGIGLALVQELVKLHGGRILVESETGKGSDFQVLIPLGASHLNTVSAASREAGKPNVPQPGTFVQEAANWLPRESAVPQPEATPSSTGRGRVLLADDNADMGDYVKRILAPYHDVAIARNGEEALKLARAHRYDLVVTDVMMPRLDGFGLLRELRGDPVLKTIPVIMLSARAGEEARVEGLNAGADDYLTKPFTARELVARVNSQLEMARIRREALEAVRRSENELMERQAELSRQVTDTRLLQRVSAEMIREQRVESLYESIIDAAVAVMDSDFASMQMFHPERGVNGELQLLTFRGFTPEAAKFWERVDADSKCCCGAALRAGRRVIVPDIDQCEFMAGTDHHATCVKTGIRAAQTTPLFSRGGKLMGMLTTHWRSPHEPSERDLNLLDIVARQAADLIERRHAEEELHLRTAQFETLLKQAPIGVYLVDADLRICQANPIALAAFGIPGGVIGRNFDEIIHQVLERRHANELVRLFRRTLETGEAFVAPTRAEYRIDRGVTEHYEWQLDRINLPDGRHGVVCYHREVSAEVKAHLAIAESAERFRFMADSMPQKIYTARPTGAVDYFNRQWTDFTGVPLQQLQERGWAQFVHPEDYEETTRLLAGSIANGTPFECVHRFRRSDGAYRWHLSRARAMRDAAGAVSMWIGSNTEIHDQKQIEEELRRLNEDLNQFAFAASHDLQEPLRMVTSYAQLLLENCGSDLNEEAALSVAYIKDGTSRMRALLADLLAYTQVSGRLGNSVEAVDFNLIHRNVISNLQEAIRESGAAITSDALPVVLGHRAHCVQLLQNLIGNAIKYRSEAPPRIHLSAQREIGAWRIAVADNGMGIEPEYHHLIFGVFKRLHGGKIPGTGMGLAICQRVVERYGGRIWVESQPGQGATFYFTLPGPEGAVS